MSRCLCNAISRSTSRSQVSRDTALLKQLKVIQHSGSTHYSGIPYLSNVSNLKCILV